MYTVCSLIYLHVSYLLCMLYLTLAAATFEFLSISPCQVHQRKTETFTTANNDCSLNYLQEKCVWAESHTDK